jgi:DNA-binding beta-propeller fold protein YncE
MPRFRPKLLATTLAAATICQSVAAAEFPNTAQNPGDLLAHALPEMGRLAVIEILGDYVITIPEIPSSPPNSDYVVRAWDISDPENPVVVATFGQTSHPFLAHGAIKRGNELYVGGWPNDAIRYNPETDSFELTSWSGPSGHWNKSGLMRPWAARHWWSYGEITGNAWLEMDGERTAEWDHLGLTGVIGFPAFMGNLLIYAADQSKSGIASYDVSDPSSPQLLDVLNRPAVHPSIVDNNWDQNPAEWGIGGYWSEISHHYMVFARRSTNPGIQVVDFSDPNNLSMHCEFLAKDPHWNIADDSYGSPMYVGFQDEWVFSSRFKLNLETCELGLQLDEHAHFVDTSQYSRPIGNLIITGGIGRNWRWPQDTNGAGMGIWVHQAETDTRAPYVSYHIPQANQTNYPVMAPISLMIPETLRSETIIVGDTLRLFEVDGDEVQIDYVLSHTGMLTVDPLEHLEANTTYELRIEGVEDAVHNAMETYSFRFSTGNSIDGSPTPAPEPNIAPIISSVSANPGPKLVNEDVIVSVIASDADDDPLEYRYRVQGQTNYSDWTSTSAFTYQFEDEGSYSINVQVRDDSGAQATDILNLSVQSVADNGAPGLQSSQIALNRDTQKLWVVNPDNDSLTRLDAETLELELEVDTADDPRSVAADDEGNLWVTAHGADLVQVFDNQGELLNSISLDYGAAPFAILLDPEAQFAYVSLYGSGDVIKIDTGTMAVSDSIALAPSARALAMDAAGSRLLVTRFISGPHYGQVWDIDLAEFTLSSSIPLHRHLENDSLEDGRGLPNYITGVTINSTGDRAYLVGKKDNVDRGLINANEDLDDDNSVRTLAMTIDLDTGQEIRGQRFDFDNADSPSSAILSENGRHLFVSMQGRNQVFAISVNTISGALGSIEAQFQVASAPQGLALDSEAAYLFAKNFLSRSVSRISLESFLNNGNPSPSIVASTSVNDEALSEAELRGKQLFYHAAEGVQSQQSPIGLISAEGYISCASCHIDGGHDGRSWDFTGRGEGLRNNISLKGRGGVRFGNVHWSANFDEIHDFENDIRNAFLGRGLMDDADFVSSEDPLGAPKAGMSSMLDDLSAYVSSLNKDSLPRSPWRRANGEFSTQAQIGAIYFEELDCSACHRGEAFTDGDTHDVGSVRSYSGQTRGQSLSEIKTPSLLGLFDSAPYLHDGSAASVAKVFELAGGEVLQAETLTLGGGAELLEAEAFSYWRSGAAVSLISESSVSGTVSSAASGQGSLRLRVGGNEANNQLSIDIGSRNYRLSIESHPSVDGIQTSYSELSFLVEYGQGDNLIRVENLSDTSIVVDDITVSLPSDFEAAQAHTRAMDLDSSERSALVQYLLELDRESAPEDDAEIVLGPINIVEPTPEPTPAPVPQPEPEPEPTPAPEASPEPTDEVEEPGLLPGAESGGGGSGHPALLFLLGLLCLGLKKPKLKSLSET